MQYRRSQTQGATFFFTVVTYDRKKILCREANAALIKEAFRYVVKQHPFRIPAFVLLPDHLHCIWTLPENDNAFSMRWRLIKSYFSRRCKSEYKKFQSASRQNKGEQCISFF
ncbi:MAG TPA: REP-associated tyrosine transposase [Candidatus Wunengus sp. YC63]|uniref:REP-associated tyrosine transposase n=1 Tax=unclassified Candidatus Wunengus TaxID=3367695 RepID=UPI0040289B64